jgi:hypothetical protein
LDGGDDVGRGQTETGELVGIKPDAHGILGTEHDGFTDAGDAADGIEDIGGDVIAEGDFIEAAVLRGKGEEHHEIACSLGDNHALFLHGARETGGGQLDLVLNLDLGGVGISAGQEVKSDGGLTRGVAAGRHVKEVVDAVEVLFQNGGDGVLQRFGGSTGVIGSDRNGGRRDVRILGDGQLGNRQGSEHHDQNGNDPGEDGSIDEETGHGQLTVEVGAALTRGLFAEAMAGAG